uniref:RNA-directed RNA polymerase L n=1 Tax=Mothra virus TaxID=1892236 RepID=A0A1L4FLT8_9VIRU|nr:RNA-dependent RNA polymerase [Mothra virus]
MELPGPAGAVIAGELALRRQINDRERTISHYEGVLHSPRQIQRNVADFFTFHRNANGKEVYWQMRQDPELGSVSGVELRLTDANLCKTKHEMVAQFFCGGFNTDAAWTLINPECPDKTTPDGIFNLGPKLWVVVEVGTTRGQPYKTYKDKFVKYLPTIADLIRRDPELTILFWIVVVSPSSVLSTFRLPNQIVDELSLRFHIGVAMEDQLITAHLMDAVAEDLTEEERAILASVRSLGEVPIVGRDTTIREMSANEHANFVKNKDYIDKSVNLMIQDTAKVMKTMTESKDAMHEAFNEIETAIEQSGGTRIDHKAPVQMPFLYATESNNEDVLTEGMSFQKSNLPEHIQHVWMWAYSSRVGTPSNFQSLPLEQEVERAMRSGFPEQPDPNRSHWHRVKIDLKQHEEKFSLDGLGGKKHKNEYYKEMRRAYQSTGFSIKANTDDIAACLNIVPTKGDVVNKYSEMLTPLLAKANELIGNTSDGLDLVREIFSSDVVTSLCQMSVVASELAVSSKQHTNKDQWVLKKILGYNIEVLVRPTNSESHIFFLMRFKGRPLEQGTFRPTYLSNGWYYTELLSINMSRLENFIRAPLTYALTLLHFRINVDRVQKQDLNRTSSSGYSEKMAMWTLLFSLEDKTQTEEMALNVRYLVMQFAKGPDPLSPPQPAPIIKKTPNVLRSRLAVHLYNQIKKYCYLQFDGLPVKVVAKANDTDHSADQFEALLCPLTHNTVNTFYDAVQIMYIAYAKNKDAQPEQNSDFAMIKKIADYVLNVNPQRRAYYDGSSDPPIEEYPGPHEYSPSFLTEACDLLCKRFTGDFGRSWQETLEVEILRKLVKTTHHESLATMKASANFFLEDAKIMAELEDLEEKNFGKLNDSQAATARILLDMMRTGNFETDDLRWAELHNLIYMSDIHKTGLGKGKFKRIAKSCKCHEAVISELRADSESVPLLIGDYPSIFRSVMESMGGVCCYLFKKNQHGGLREIYVLTFKSRLLQLLPEVAARVICGMCPEEVLTHPDKKISGYENHQTNVMSSVGQGTSTQYIHRTSSEDKSKWSQGMNVSAFNFMFARLLSPKWSNAISRVMHAFRNKKVMVPEGVMSIFEQRIPLSDPTYMTLMEDYNNTMARKHFENQRGRMFLLTPTGMWQGILHYCSSLLHVLQTLHYKHLCKMIFLRRTQEYKNANDEGLGVFLIDTVVSSDDSATYASIVLPQGFTQKTLVEADKVLDQLMKLEVTHSRFFMMIESPKSCISSKTVGEFNSIFSCSRTYISPTIKKVLAAATIPENEDLESRQVVISNMLKDILEEGGSHFQIHVTELMISFLHYTAFGLGTSRLFQPWADLIIEHPDTHLGFMVVDLMDISGTFGFDFKKYMSLRLTEVPLMASMPAALKAGIEGSFNSGVVLTQGDRTRWKNFVKRVVRPGWEAYLEANPEVLYMERGISKEQIEARLSSKACSKGVHEALKQGNSMSRLISSSVYLLARNVITVKKLNMVTEGGAVKEARESEKKSLLSLTASQMQAEADIVVHSEMTEEQRAVFYPNSALHLAVANSMMTMRGKDLIRTVRYRRVRNTIEVRGSTNTLVLPIMQVLRWKWLGSRVKMAKTTLDYSWAHYLSVFPWLRDTLRGTLEFSPFETHTGLFSFFQGVDKKSARLSVLCRRVRSLNPHAQLVEMAKHNQYPELRYSDGHHYVVEEKVDSASRPTMDKISAVTSVLTAIIHSPYIGDIEHFSNEIAETIEFTDDELVTLSKTRAFSRVATLQSVIENRPNEEVERMLLNSGQGVVKLYKHAQVKRGDSWSGPGRLIVKTKTTSVEVLVHDTHIIAIKTPSLPALEEEYALISSYLSSDGFDWDLPKNVRAYKEHFRELGRASLHDVCCSNKSLWRVPRASTYTKTAAGRLITKAPPSGWDMPFPVVIRSTDEYEGYIQGKLTILKVSDGIMNRLELVSTVDGRELTLMRYYGPRKPIADKKLEELFEDKRDSEDLMSTWLYHGRINWRFGLDMLAWAAELEDATPEMAVQFSNFHTDRLRGFLIESFKSACKQSGRLQMNQPDYVSELNQVYTERFEYSKDMKDAVYGVNFDDFMKVVDEKSILDEEGAVAGALPDAMGSLDVPTVHLDRTTSEGPLAMDDDEPVSDSPRPNTGEVVDWYADIVPDIPIQFDDVESVSADQIDPSTGSKSLVDTHEVNPDMFDFKTTPLYNMSHPFWTEVIIACTRGGVWEAIEKGFRLQGASARAETIVCQITGLIKAKLPDLEDLDDEL